MGIPYFYRFIRNKDYKGVLRRGVPKYVSSFMLDFNGIIHKVAQIVYAYGEGNDPQRRKLVEQADPQILEAEFYQALATKLSEIIFQVNPQDILVIAVDGVAPQAKMSQQRQRRFKSAIERSQNSVFDSNSITPGTDFMMRLDNFIQRWLVSASKILPPKTIYSSHMVQGEGEHKVLSLIREGQIKGDGAHVIYGMDADLIMLSMLAPLDHIFLMREDIRDVIDIDNLKYALSQEIGTRTAIPDYVLMTFMIGNDFLPHMPAFDDMEEAIDTMIRVYKMLGRPLTISKTKEIDWDSFVLFLAEMAKEEHRLLELESHKDYKYPSRMMNASISRTQKKSDGGAMELTSTKIEIFTKFDPNIFRGAWYQNAFEPKGDKAVFEKLLPGYNLGATPEKIINMVKTYLVGINWVYRYYNMGMDGINTDWVYKYHYAPLLTDISAVASQISSVDGYKPRSDNLTVNPVHQLLSVLPLKSKDLLPQEVKHLMTRDSPIADIYPESAIIELDGKNYEWQGIAIIPFVEMKRIINVVNQTTIFTQERLEQFSSKDNIELVKDPSQMEIDEKTMKFRQFLERKKREEFIRGNRRYRSKGRGRGRGRSRDDRRNPYKR